ncbi:MAG TPA: type II toxin-antitoxin system RelE/ParE family toxin [Polyangia bacterium]|nr:type II toxin-antitoxin system RelE/ParE family toxin [Polyangia bacterium]
MASYSLEIKKSAARELGELPSKECAHVAARIQALADESRPHGCEKLSGDEKYRIRQGVYRVLNEIDDGGARVTIVKIAHRREAHL